MATALREGTPASWHRRPGTATRLARPARGGVAGGQQVRSPPSLGTRGSWGLGLGRRCCVCWRAADAGRATATFISGSAGARQPVAQRSLLVGTTAGLVGDDGVTVGSPGLGVRAAPLSGCEICSALSPDRYPRPQRAFCLPRTRRGPSREPCLPRPSPGSGAGGGAGVPRAESPPNLPTFLPLQISGS